MHVPPVPDGSPPDPSLPEPARTLPPLPDVVLRPALQVGMLVLAALAVLAVWNLFGVLLLVFAGLLFAVFLRSLVKLAERWLFVPKRFSFGFSLITFVAVVVAIGGLVVPSLVEQGNLLAQRLPVAVGDARDTLGRTAWGRNILAQLPTLAGAARAGTGTTGTGGTTTGTTGTTGTGNGTTGTVSAGPAGTVETTPPVASGRGKLDVGGILSGLLLPGLLGTLSGTLGALGALSFVLFVGLFVGASPRGYRENFVGLLPPAARPGARSVLGELGHTLEEWLLGQALGMAIAGLATGLGLWALGVPFALTLGLLTALLQFVPYVGPVVSAVPALLIAFLVSPEKAVQVLILIFVVQQVIGSIVMPIIAQRTVDLSPLLSLTATLIAGTLFGVLGVLLATPAAAIFVTLLKRFRREVYGDPAP